jgi:ubiquinone/menaquinone biosynthesis C-methylase UbiE
MTAPARFGRLARVYRFMEYLSFGPWLLRCRMLRLPEMLQARSALVYGDGDGRFVARLAQAAPQMQIVAVDASSAMLQRTAMRLAPGARVSLQQANALTYTPAQPCELVVSHFFLDCFSTREAGILVRQLRPGVAHGTRWVISDFAIPSGTLPGLAGRVVVRSLYLAFGLLTGLRTRRLPDHGSALSHAGWQLEDRQLLLAGLLVSERWRFTEAADMSH